MTVITLCQDCLAEVPLASTANLIEADKNGGPHGNALCKCGGDVCSCDECMETLELLHAGCRDPQKLGVRSQIQLWTPTTGISSCVEPKSESKG